MLIPSLGLGYSLISLGRRFTSAVWNWGKPSAARRAVSAVCLVSAAGLLGFTWLPQFPLPGRAPQAAPVSLGPISPVTWQPIGADERGTVQDIVSDAAAGTTAASPTLEPATSQPSTQQTPQPTALPPVTDVQTRGTPEPTVAATPGPTTQAAEPTAQAPGPTTQAAVQGTTVPRATLTPTLPPLRTATVPPRGTPTPVR